MSIFSRYTDYDNHLFNVKGAVMVEPAGIIFGVIILTFSYGMSAKLAIRKENNMAETTSKEAKAELMSERQFNELLDTNHVVMGKVAVHGTQLLSPKFLDILNHVLTREPWGIEVMMFSVDQPHAKYGLYSVSRKTVVINVGQHWESAIKLVKHDDHYLSVRAHLWHNMLLSLFHECLHGKAYLVDFEATSKMTDEDKEDMSETEARVELEQLVLNFDIEPSPMAEEPFFGTRYMQLFIDAIANGTETWAVRQNEMHDEKYLYLDEQNDVLVESFRDYLRGAFDTNRKDKSWDTITPQVIAKYSVPLLEAPVAEASPTTIIVDEQGAAVVAAIEIVDDTLSEPLEMADKVGWEDEALEHLLGESHIHEGPTATAAAPVAAQPLPTADPATCAFCGKCGANLVVGNAFCSGCGNPTTATATPIVETTPFTPWVEPTVAPTPVMAGAPTPGAIPMQPVGTAQQWQTAYNAPQQTHEQNRRIEKLDTNLPPHALTGVEMSAIIREIYMRLYNFCFDKCGWQMPLADSILQDTAGTLCRDGFHRDVRQACQGGISVADIPGATQLIYAYRSYDHTGNLRKIPADGMIRGWVAKEAKIPMFNLYLNVNAPLGEALKRVFIPQNPYKVKNGKYTDTAMAAQRGERLAYIINGDDRLPDNDPGKYVADIKAGVLNIKAG
jgi:hypothetical protein